MNKNQKGFSVVEMLMLLVIVGLIGFIGWYVWHTKSSTDKNLNSATDSSSVTKVSNSSSSTSSTDAYAGWQGFCSTQEKACFKYPSDWKTQATSDTGSDGDSTEIVSPAGSVVDFQSSISGLGGACDPASSPHVFIHKVTAQGNVSNLYIVESGEQNNTNHIGIMGPADGKAPKTGDTDECLFYTTFSSKQDPNNGVSLQARGGDDDAVIKSTDVPTIELILKSYKYD